MLDVFEDLHGVVFAVEDLGHDFHVALGNSFFIPQLLEVRKGLVYGLLLTLLAASEVRLVADLVCMSGRLLLSREASWRRLALLRSLRSFLDVVSRTFCWGCAIYS